MDVTFGGCITDRHFSEPIQEEIFQLNNSDDSEETGISQTLYSFGFLSKKNALFANQCKSSWKSAWVLQYLFVYTLSLSNTSEKQDKWMTSSTPCSCDWWQGRWTMDTALFTKSSLEQGRDADSLPKALQRRVLYQFK